MELKTVAIEFTRKKHLEVCRGIKRFCFPIAPTQTFVVLLLLRRKTQCQFFWIQLEAAYFSQLCSTILEFREPISAAIHGQVI